MRPTTGFLNAFRALAALWVVVAHCMIWAGDATIPALIDPKSAVDIFIVLSGFLMMYVASGGEGQHWGGFYVRRFFRIAPLYYLVLLAIVFLQVPFLAGYQQLVNLNPPAWEGSAFHPQNVTYDPTNLVLHFTFLFGLVPQYSASTMLPDWSLGLEAQFYAVFPLLYLAQQRCGLLLVGGLGALVAAGCLWLQARGIVPAFLEPSLLGLKLHLFMVGMLLFGGWSSDRTGLRWACMAAGVIICIMQYRLYGPRTLTVTALVLAMVCLLTPATVSPVRDSVRRLLDGPIIRFLADVSYSVYLLHGLFLAMLGGAIATFAHQLGLEAAHRVAVVVLVVLPTTYAASYLTFKYIERPMIRVGRQLAARITGGATAQGREVRAAGPER